jgi:acetyl esterase/lipase
MRMLTIVVTTLWTAAAVGVEIRLWDGAVPAASGTAPTDTPVVSFWKAPQAEGAAGPTPAIVICPGGAYANLAVHHEGYDYAKWLNQQGISAFVLRYRLGTQGYRHPVMLGDIARAVRRVRHEHEKFGVDPRRVGVIGSSAGGHLALTLLTHGDAGDPAAADPIDRQPSRPDLGILCYPVVSMTKEKGHGGSRKNLLGDAPADDLVRDLSGELMPEERIRGMPPLFIWHTFEDQAVQLGPILQLGERLTQQRRPFALHVYEKGRHGLGLGVQPFDPLKLHPWAGECSRWLADQGFARRPDAQPAAPAAR